MGNLYKIWGFHGGDYEECRPLECNNPVRSSQETHYVSVTKTRRLILCKFWGLQGGIYEECRLLGYKDTVLISQEIYRVSATEPSRLILCKILGFHGGDYENCSILGYKYPIRTSQETILFRYRAVSLKNAVFWDIKAQFASHRKYITSPLQSPAG
jgi:hypothetical protein